MEGSSDGVGAAMKTHGDGVCGALAEVFSTRPDFTDVFTSRNEANPDIRLDKLCRLLINVQLGVSGSSNDDSVKHFSKHSITAHTDHSITAMERDSLQLGKCLVGTVSHNHLG